jgi:hypothetical protein
MRVEPFVGRFLLAVQSVEFSQDFVQRWKKKLVGAQNTTVQFTCLIMRSAPLAAMRIARRLL